MTGQNRDTAVDSTVARARFGSDGLIPAIVQESGSNDVLMLAWMDAEAMRRTLTGGLVTFWSRSRQEYWRKGDTSGHHLVLTGFALDCDTDAVLVTVEPVAVACHTGTHSCFDAHPEES